jgi:hypothetical protein
VGRKKRGSDGLSNTGNQPGLCRASADDHKNLIEKNELVIQHSPFAGKKAVFRNKRNRTFFIIAFRGDIIQSSQANILKRKGYYG